MRRSIAQLEAVLDVIEFNQRHASAPGRFFEEPERHLRNVIRARFSGRKSPEGVFFAEQPTPTEGSIRPVLKRFGWYEMAETITKLAD